MCNTNSNNGDRKEVRKMRKEQYFYINEASCFMKNDKPNAAPMQDENPIPKPPVVQQDFYSEWIIESASDAFVNCLMSKKQ